MRSSGILLPISSLPSKYGIGCFSKEAYDFIDFLSDAKQSYWQILPIVPTGYGDSPYSSSSTFAGNSYFICLETLVNEGLIDKKDIDKIDFGKDKDYIDYSKIYNNRFKILKKAYENSSCNNDRDFVNFCKRNKKWLDDYSLYASIKSKYPVECTLWDKDLFNRDKKTLSKYARNNAKDIECRKYIQYLFEKQWKRLKKYANDRGIKIIGDLPIYVAMDSSDYWANPDMFMIDKDNLPVEVAGCPPDGFSADGQLWGNPLYDWKKHEAEDFAWWERRIRRCMQWYDTIRIDHFRGFEAFYCIPRGNKNARIGQWRKGPGMKLFNSLNKKIKNMDIIAEDLGFLNDDVIKLLKKSGYPGMKVLEFAFDSREESDYMPHNYERNCVVYTGTHDNQTACGWYDSLPKATKSHVDSYIGRNENSEPINIALIRLAMSSVADTCIIPMQDYLGLSDEARMNHPSTLGGINWRWRVRKRSFTKKLAKKIRRMTELYGRACRESN